MKRFEGEIVSCEREKVRGSSDKKTAYKSPEQFYIPAAWREKDMFGELQEYFERQIELTAENYVSRFHDLLWTEELKLENEMLLYSMDKVGLKTNSKGFQLLVPGTFYLSFLQPQIKII